MEDNEIIKALDWCANHSCCDGCTFGVDGRCVNTNTSVYYKAVLDIINRQKAEIASLEARRREDCETILAFNHELLHIKIDAIKEFVERLKAIYDNDERYATYYAHTLIVKLFYKIDDLVEKMTEDNRGEREKLDSKQYEKPERSEKKRCKRRHKKWRSKKKQKAYKRMSRNTIGTQDG